jgi:hypothetical protein
VRSAADAIPICLLLLFVVALLIVFRLRADNPLGVRTDSWTEATVIVSARNVAANGWAKYHGASPQQIDRPPFKSDSFYYYTRYPLGGYYVNWAFYKLGAKTLGALRWPVTLLSLTSLILWYVFLCRFVGRWAALASTLFMGTAYGFLDFADNVHHAYGNVLPIGVMLSFAAALRYGGRKRIGLLAAAWLLLFINSCMSWEWYLWSQIFFWGYAVLLGVPFKKRWLMVFALAPLLVVGSLSLMREEALGPHGAHGILNDFLRRTIRLEDTIDTPRDVTLANYPLHIARRFQQFYGMGLGSVWLLALAWGLVFGGLRRSVMQPHPAFRLIILFFLCGISWWCVMIQHTAVHPGNMRHALLFYSLVIGLSVTGALSLLFGLKQRLWMRAAGLAVLAFVLWSHGARTYQNIRLHLDRNYPVPNGWDEGWSESANLSDLARKLPADAILLTNISRMPLLRYWTGLPAYPGTFSPYPFNRYKAVPGARYRVELTINHLRELYGAHLPRVLYVYFFLRAPARAYMVDPMLRKMIDGEWKLHPDTDHAAHAEQVIRQIAARGGGQAYYPVIAAGFNWLCFDISTMFDNLPQEFLRLGPPTRADYGPTG